MISCGFLEFVVVFEEPISEVIVNLEPVSDVFEESSAGSGEKIGSGETSLDDILELLDERAVLLPDSLE